MFSVGTLAGFLELEDRLSPALKIAERNLAVTSGKLEDMGRGFTRLGQDMLPLALAVGGFGIGAIKMASDFESSFAGVRKTVDATEPELQALSHEFRQLAKEIPTSVNEINRIAEAGGQLGVASSDLLQFTEVMAAMGVTTNLTSDEAATALAQIANIIDNEAGPQFDRLGATVVELGNKSAATEKDIVEFGLRLAGAGKVAGLTEAEILGIGSALASVGINAEAGGTAFSKVFIDISAAVSQGGEHLEQFAEIAGVTAQDFSQTFKADPAAAILSFVEGLGRIQKAGGDLFGVIENLGISEQRMRDALLRSAGAGDLLRKSLETATTAFEENTALAEEAGKRYETFASQVQLLWNEIYDIGITIGSALIPAVRSAMDVMKPWLQSIADAAKDFAKLPPEIHAIALALGAFVAVSPAVLFFFGSATTLFGSLAGAALPLIKGLGSVYGAWTGLLATLGTGTGVIATIATKLGIFTYSIEGMAAAIIGVATGPIGLMIAAFTAVSAIILTVTGGWDELGSAISDSFTFFKDVGTIIMWVGEVALKTLIDWVKTAIDFIPGLSTVIESMGWVLDKLGDAFSYVGDAIAKFTASARAEVNRFAESIRAAADNGVDAITPLTSALQDDLAKNALPAVAANIGKVDEAGSVWGNGLADLNTQVAAASKKAKEYREEVTKLAEVLGGNGAIREAEKYADALRDVKNISLLTKEQQEDVNEIMYRAIEAYRRQGKEAPEAIKRIFAETSNLEFKMQQLTSAEIAAVEAVSGNAWDSAEVSMQQYGKFLDTVHQEWLDWLKIVEDPAPWTQADANVKEYIENMTKYMVYGTGISKTFGEKLRAGLAENLKDALTDIPGIIAKGLAEGGSGKDIAEAIGSVVGAAVGKALGEAIGGKIGGKIGEALGAVGGALIGKLADALNVSAGEDIMHRVGRDWGIAITEGMGDAIAESAKTMFGGNRSAAEVFNIDKIIGAAGGINVKNFDTLIAKLRDTFVHLSTGVFEASDAVKVLDDNFGAFADHATARGALVNKAFLEIIKLAEEAGLRVGAIDEFVSEQVGSAVEGIAALLAPGILAMDKLKEKQKELTDLKEKASKATGDSLKGLNDEIAALEKEMTTITVVAVASQEAAYGLSSALFASFAELVERGTPLLDALEQISPAVDMLREHLIAAGFDGGAAFDMIARMSALASDEIAGPLLEAIHGGSQALLGLHNAGILNQEMFGGLTEQITATFNSLVAQGKDGRAAMQALAPDIQRIWELQQDFGYVVDENTQLLIDQAVEAGLVGDAHRDAQDRAIKAMQDAAVAMEKVAQAIEDAFLSAGEASERFADKVVDSVSEIPSNPFAGWQIPDIQIPDIPDFPNPYDSSGYPVVPMASGGEGKVNGPTLFLAGEAGPEEWKFSGAGKTFDDSSRGEDPELRREMSEIATLLRDMPFTLTAAMKTAGALQ